jgi:hypothetical protein
VTGTRKIPGVLTVRIEPLDNILTVTYDGRVTDEPSLLAAIRVVIDSVN